MDNVDPKEIEKFSRLAHKWWDTNGEFKPLHDINPLRLNFICEHAGVLGQTVDVGCGGGILSEALAKAAKSVLGIDMAEESLACARLHAQSSALTNVHYECVRVEDLAQQQAEQFDTVVCMEMLEHVPDPASVIHACAQLAKPGGRVFLSTINRNHKAWLHAIAGAEYILRLLPRGTHDYQRFITPAEMARMTRAAGLIWDCTTGLTYHLAGRTYSLTDDVSVNYMVALHKPA